MRHLLITGDKGVGKTEMLEKLAKELSLPLGGGFITTMEAPEADGAKPVYIHSVDGPREYGEDNLVGHCKNQHATGYPQVFDRFAYLLENKAGPGHILYMDEIGIMEEDAAQFCQGVLRLLDGDIPVLAAVRPMDIPFLAAVRSHPNALCLRLTEDNQALQYERAVSFLQKALATL